MGVSWEELQSGVLDTGKVVAETMALWNQVTGKTPAPTAATSIPAGGGSTVPTAQTQSSSAGTGTARTMDIPQWLLAAAAVGLAWLLFRSR